MPNQRKARVKLMSKQLEDLKELYDLIGDELPDVLKENK